MIPRNLASLLLAALAATASAQQSISNPRLPYRQSFDIIEATTTLPEGWRRGEIWTSGIPDLTKVAGTYGSGVVTGSSDGGAYNWAYGSATTGWDRAVGFLSSGGLLGFSSPCHLGYAFRNDTGETIQTLELSWNYEKYRSGTRAFDWTFSHGASAAAMISSSAGAHSYSADSSNTVVYNPPATEPKSFRLNGLSIAPNATYYLRWTYTGAGGSSNAQGLGIDDFSINLIAPSLTVTQTLTEFSSNYKSASAAQTFDVSGSDLTAAVTVTAPENFEVSGDGVTFSPTIVLETSALPATVHVRLSSLAPVGSYRGGASLTSPGAVTRQAILSGVVHPPSLSVSSSEAETFSAQYGSVSAPRMIDVSATNPVGPVTVSAPSNFEISTDGNSYSTSLTLNTAELPASVFARLTASAPVGVVSGSVTVTSEAAESKSLIISGVVIPPVLTPSVTSLSSFSADYGSSSATQTIVISASNPVGPVIVTAPLNFEISKDGVSYASVLTLSPAELSVTIHVRVAATSPGGAVTGLLTFTSNGAAEKSVSLSGFVQGVITPSVSSLSGFWVFENFQPSAKQTFTIGGGNLKGPVNVTAPSGFEISRNGTTYTSSLTLNANGINAVYTNGVAFAALRNDGSVVTWGAANSGGDSSSVAEQLQSDVVAIYGGSPGNAFAAIKTDGSVVTWGYGEDANTNGVSGLSSGVVSISHTSSTFAALKNNGSVVTWGDSNMVGWATEVSQKISSDVISIHTSRQDFSALKNGGGVVTWGYSFQNQGAPSPSIVYPSAAMDSGVIAIKATDYAFAGIKTDGSVVTWGFKSKGADTSNVVNHLGSEVASIASTSGAFAALKKDGSVVAWGELSSGGSIPAAVTEKLTSGVIAIYSNRYAFAALKDDGSVVTWGNAASGGDSSAVSGNLNSGVVRIYSSGTLLASSSAFAALKSDGSVVAWGDVNKGGQAPSVLSNQPSPKVTNIYSNDYAFAAVRSDGSVVTWGGGPYGGGGGNSSSVSSQLASDVVSITPIMSGFAALKRNGSVVNWGLMDLNSNTAAKLNVELPTIVHVRMAINPTLGPVTGELTLTSPGAQSRAVALSGSVIEPNVIPSVNSLSGFATIAGNPSESQSFAIQGENVIYVVRVAAPSGYQVSSNGFAWTSSVSIAPADLPATVWVRLAASAPEGQLNQDLTISTSGMPEFKYLALSGMVSATATSPSSSWRLFHFGIAANTGNAADLATPDGDGIVNLIKYGLCITPGTNGRAGLPALLRTDDGRLSLRFRRDPTRTDVNVVVEAQSSLGGSWGSIAESAGGNAFTGSATITETNNQDGTRTVEVKDSVPISSTPKRFLRVRVEAASGDT